MKTALLLLLGGFLCGLHRAEDQDPDLLIIITKLLTRVQTLETKVQSHQSEDQSLQSEVQSLQSEVQSLKNQTQDLETKDQSHQSQVQSLKTQIQDLETKDQSHQSQVQSLKTQIQTLENSQAQPQTNPRVAFFAGFYSGTEDGNYGPFNDTTIIKYKKVLTNVGGGYSADTGKFTAPLRGTYVFTFVVLTNTHSFVTLRKNGNILVQASDKTSDKWDSTTSVVVVTLEAGDTVYVVLEPQRHFYDYLGFYNTFSGFLLFPMNET